MQLPEALHDRILELSRAISPGELQKAAQRLSEVYRKDSVPPPLRTEAERLAYLLVRMPATYAAIHHALAALLECLPGWEPKSMLDLGAGPGTGLWAAIEIHHQLENADAVEREAAFVQLAMKLAPAFSRSVGWKISDLQSWKPDRKYDLVLASYAIGELSADVRKRLVSAAWEACTGALIFVEPRNKTGIRRDCGGAGAIDLHGGIDCCAMPARPRVSDEGGRGLVPFFCARRKDSGASQAQAGRTRARGREILLRRSFARAAESRDGVESCGIRKDLAGT